ncbi:MAG TPA: rRNA maturation RNase YbeY [Planctomycetota bacterium]|jgi:probable rRNA maturation factor|nr:rRNA maturation RNase YbeY [Planctomycetota bacterium]
MRRPRTGRIGVAWAVRARPLTDRDVRAAVRAALAHGRRPDLDVDVALVSDRRLATIHARFLGDPSPTDVIAFDLGADGGGPAAEIYASVDCARRVAREREVDAASELRLYLVHGALHLCGYDDLRPAARRLMRAAEEAVLASLRGTRSGRPYKKNEKT